MRSAMLNCRTVSRTAAPVMYLTLVAASNLRAGQSPVWQGQVGQSSVTVVAHVENGFKPDPYYLHIQRPSGEVLQVLLGQGEFGGVSVWNNVRAAVVIGHELSVVNVANGTILDSFRCSWPSASPDGRFIAFQAVITAGSPDSSVYLVYDVVGSANSNRMVPMQSEMEMIFHAGLAVFPEFNRVNQSYERPDGRDPHALHSLRSPIKWLDSTRFAFVDYQGSAVGTDGVLDAVVIDLTPGVGNVNLRVATVDATKINDMKRAGDRQDLNPGSLVSIEEVVPVEVTPTTYRLRLRIRENGMTIASDYDVDM